MRTVSKIEELEGYKRFINTFGQEFIDFIENYNLWINDIENMGLVGNLNMKARIKDFLSAQGNTRKKILDDVFGIEVITPTEFSKEFMCLINILAFKQIRNKSYNKENGYKAYHGLEKVKHLKDIENLDFERIINETMINEYCKTRKDIIHSKEDISKKLLFPTLIKYIKKPKNLKNLKYVLKTVLKRIKEYSEIKELINVPLIEFQIKTSEVADNAIRGKASHYKYKNVNEEEIKTKLINKRFIRGLNAPWRFERIGGKIQAQRFINTIIENWSFLNDYILENNLKINEIAQDNISINRAFASVFPFFGQYILTEEECKKIEQFSQNKKEEIWEELKKFTIADRVKYPYTIEDFIGLHETIKNQKDNELIE